MVGRGLSLLKQVQLKQVQLPQNPSYTSLVSGNGRWRSRSAVERRGLGCPLGSLRAAEGGKSSVTKPTLNRFVCGAAFIWLPFWYCGRFLFFGISERGAGPRHWFLACYILAQLAGIAFLASTVSRKQWVLSLLSVASMICGSLMTLALGLSWFSN